MISEQPVTRERVNTEGVCVDFLSSFNKQQAWSTEANGVLEFFVVRRGPLHNPPKRKTIIRILHNQQNKKWICVRTIYNICAVHISVINRFMDLNSNHVEHV